MALGDAVNNLFDQFVSERLGVSAGEASMAGIDSDLREGDEDSVSSTPEQPQRAGREMKRAALRQLAHDGLLLGLAQRTALKALLSSKVLGLGGAALALVIAAPPLVRKLSSLRSRSAGAMQGSPISPLLSNVYLHPFDQELSGQGYRLVRYCDDFIVPARSKAEAEDALEAANVALKSRRLRLNREKTRVVEPGEPFAFLGYQFTADGRILPPPSIPSVVARRMIEFADRYRSRASICISGATKTTRSAVDRFLARLRKG